MRAMVLDACGAPLSERSLPVPEPKRGQVLIKVGACGVCRTDLHVKDGDLKGIKLPIIPGHEIVGLVEAVGPEVEGLKPGDRVCVPWMGGTCSECPYCLNQQENLCDHALFTGYTIDGGFAEYTVADANFCFPAPPGYSDIELAPLLCAGLIGWRSYKFACQGTVLGIYGFGAAAHIVSQVALYRGKRVFAFTRRGDVQAQAFAIEHGAEWAGDSDVMPPSKLDAAIIFAPVGELVPLALKASNKGAVIVCGGIHMSDIPQFPYSSLWWERSIKSVANLTREDGIEFLEFASKVPIRTQTIKYDLSSADQALEDLRQGLFSGAAVLVP